MRLIGDQLAGFICDDDFVDLYPPQGKPGLSPTMLALVTIFQRLENLSDSRAVAMVVRRIDVKYALHLPLDYTGFDPSVLCEYRDRLEEHQAEGRILDKILEWCRGVGLLRARGCQRTDSFGVLSAVRNLNRLELVWETLRVALLALEKADVTWLADAVPLSWADRYGERGMQEKLVREEGEERKRKSKALAEQVGRDGLLLLAKVDDPQTPEHLRGLPEIETLRQVWAQQYEIAEGGPRWLVKVTTPRAEVIQTPHDPDVRYATKGDEGWEGYKVEVTETADEDLPHLITDVDTVLAPTPDFGMAEEAQERLAEKELLPSVHQVDSGYVTGDALAASADRGVKLVGPVRKDSGAQARIAGGITADQFEIDREKREARCPAGAVSVEWRERHEEGRTVTHVEFDGAVCGGCPNRGKCVMSDNEGSGRSLTLREHHELVQQRRREQKTAEFKKEYQGRAGIEGTLSEMDRAHGLRQARYRGLARVHLQHLMIAVATNLKRITRWCAGAKREKTRELGLRRLAAAGKA